jgi:hypothetical protein
MAQMNVREKETMYNWAIDRYTNNDYYYTGSGSTTESGSHPSHPTNRIEKDNKKSNSYCFSGDSVDENVEQNNCRINQNKSKILTTNEMKAVVTAVYETTIIPSVELCINHVFQDLIDDSSCKKVAIELFYKLDIDESGSLSLMEVNE